MDCPDHYKIGNKQAIEIIKEILNGLNPEPIEAALLYNILKYVMRYKKKNGNEDLDKAIVCIQLLKGENKKPVSYSCSNVDK